MSDNVYKFTDADIERLVSLYKKSVSSKRRKIDGNFEIERLSTKEHLNFKTTELVYSIKTKKMDFVNFMENLEKIFKKLLDIARLHTQSDNDYVRFVFLKAPKRPFSTSVLKIKDFEVQYFLDTLEKFMNSGKEVIADGWNTIATIYIFHNKKIPPKPKPKKTREKPKQKKIYAFLGKGKDDGGGIKFPKKNNRSIRHGVYHIASQSFNKLIDGCCFVIALLVAFCFLKDKVKSSEIKRKKDLDQFFSIEEIRKVYVECGLSEGKIYGKDYEKIYNNFLKNKGIDLVVYSDQYYNMIVYDSRTDEDGNLLRLTNDLICLWLNNNHYDVIENLRIFTGTNSFCFKCMKKYGIYEYEFNHICKTTMTCLKCYSSNDKCEKTGFFKCTNCNIFFDNFTCFQNHLTQKVFQGRKKPNKITPCQYLFFCNTCYKTVPRFMFVKKDKFILHNCEKNYCRRCKKYEKDHKCYIKPIKEIENQSFPTLYLFDFETKTAEDGEMIPFYAVVQKVCITCDQKEFVKKSKIFKKGEEEFSDESVEKVECCGYRQYVFEKNGESVVDDLIEFMLKQNNAVWIAHNGSRFDTVFLLRHLLTKKNLTPNVIMCGNKVMMLEIPFINSKVLDSYLFLDMALAEFPKSMGFDDLTKGYHPYFFTDLNYIGPMVDLKYFDLKRMNEKEMIKFKEWYNKKCEKEYIFREEIYYYCVSDVDILRKGCLTFSHLMYKITHVFPFYDSECITIASIALKVYKLNFLKKDQLGLLPETGYRGNVNQSLIALCWLNETNNETPIDYRLSLNGEKKILGRYVDGYCEATNTVYQFHGCFYHGCEKCFDSEQFNAVLNETYYNLREKTNRFTKLLRSSGYNVIEKWECEYLNETKFTNKILNEKKQFFYRILPLEPRDALYGGRTSPACLNYQVKDGEKITYLDFTSLYPAVQKKNVFPTGHPTIYIDKDCSKVNVESVFGLIKCMILPPQNLLFAVLPVKIGGKLIFPLCMSCAKEKSKICEHLENERCLFGTWTSIEINKAIEKGYKIIKIYEIYNYEKREKLFGEYVNTFLKIKQESSGIPKSCLNDQNEVDEELYDKFINDFKTVENVSLDRDKIKKNPALRTIAKKLLNSLWGKLAQNDNSVVVTFLNDYYSLLELLNDNSIELTTIDFISENIVRCTYKKKLSTATCLENRNVIIASFVTAYARLELYRLLDKIGKNVLYFDTDSVLSIFDSSNEIKTGNFLGDLTNELEEENCSEIWIDHFCSTGPKCYSYITNEFERTDPKTKEVKKEIKEVTHVKGFSLKSNDIKKKLNFTSLQNCIKDEKQKITITYQNKIIRNNQQQVLVEDETKDFSFTFDKRIVKDDFTTVPFGYLDGGN